MKKHPLGLILLAILGTIIGYNLGFVKIEENVTIEEIQISTFKK